ncbi:MAG: GNAT family N-acetyltransferase [Pseudomonadota bacterium]
MLPAIEDSEAGPLDLAAEGVWPPARLVRLGGWRCRLDRGVTRRANSVLALEAPASELGSAIDQVEKLYRELGLRPCFQITPACRPGDLPAVLVARGYRTEGSSWVMGAVGDRVASEAKSATTLGTPGDDLPVALAPRADDAWMDCYQAGIDPATRQVRRSILSRIEEPAAFAQVGAEDEIQAVGVAACARGTVWINCMQTAPTFRRRGAARRILGALARWALDQKPAPHHNRLYLQVEADNGPARALYEGLGFQTLYAYHYMVRP